jgi:CHAT domain-containing protein
LAVVPTGTLAYLPFAALSKAPGKYLVQSRQVVTLLKSSDLAALGVAPNPNRDGLLALANPDGSLPAATQEASEIAGLFATRPLLGAEATAERLQEPGPVAYLHLATHGTLNSRNPAASQLLLASGGLTVSDIYRLRLPGVRLGTLSACQTALGEINPGADLTTLADAFSLAGASSVVASLWSVSDESTRELMVEFYRRIKAGETLGQALQEAQLKLLAAGRTPFQWAPFVLIGDWR